jgi:putative transposase
VIHSDQGSQYGSDDWRRFCQRNRLEPSMSRRGNCWDNAVAESFFASLKKERIRKRIYVNREAAIEDRARLHRLLLQSGSAAPPPRRRQPRRI